MANQHLNTEEFAKALKLDPSSLEYLGVSEMCHKSRMNVGDFQKAYLDSNFKPIAEALSKEIDAYRDENLRERRTITEQEEMLRKAMKALLDADCENGETRHAALAAELMTIEDAIAYKLRKDYPLTERERDVLLDAIE